MSQFQRTFNAIRSGSARYRGEQGRDRQTIRSQVLYFFYQPCVDFGFSGARHNQEILKKLKRSNPISEITGCDVRRRVGRKNTVSEMLNSVR
jgi:hypothetical protein